MAVLQITKTATNFQESSAKKEISAAWQKYQQTEKYGLMFGRVCYEWQQKFVERGQRIKGRGLVPILEQLNIPISTAYWWINRHKQSIGQDPLMSSSSPEWYTPPHIIDRVVKSLGEIDLDPCSNEEKTVPAREHFTKTENGLDKPWNGRVYMNPPYGDAISDWTEKLLTEYANGHVTEAIALVPARVDTAWFRPFNYAIFISGRLKFSSVQNPAPFPSALLYLGPNPKVFRDTFRDLGEAWKKDND